MSGSSLRETALLITDCLKAADVMQTSISERTCWDVVEESAVSATRVDHSTGLFHGCFCFLPCS